MRQQRTQPVVAYEPLNRSLRNGSNRPLGAVVRRVEPEVALLVPGLELIDPNVRIAELVPQHVISVELLRRENDLHEPLTQRPLQKSEAQPSPMREGKLGSR